MVGRVFLGRYETVQLLGEGGMGRVYLAKQADLGRQVVVKVMHDHVAADATFRERFVRETLLMARFQHPYAVTLYDASLNDPQGPCIVMEYIKGITLDALLQSNGRLSPQRVGRLLRQLCEVLQAAHTAGIVHRDLKPANLMIVDPETQYELIKVMDFGLAKLLAPEAGHPDKVTNTEFAVGTPGYMCPEQARGEEMDHRGDLYSVGVVLYEVLAGRLPFSGKSTMDVLLAHATEEPPPFSFVGAAGWVTPAIEEVVRACLAKDPAERPRDARELAERYEAALAADAAAVAAATAPRAPSSTAAHMQKPPALRGQRLPAPPQPSAPAAAPVQQPEPAQAPTRPPARSVPAKSVPAAALTDPRAVVHKIDAWMPERIASYKLHGFIHDAGGDVLESVPGRIRVRLGGRGSAYTAPRRGFSLLGLGRTAVFDLELHLQRPVGGRENQLTVTVVVRPPPGEVTADLAWQDVCGRIFCDLRAYLMGQSGAVSMDSAV
jgi:eukaryotic-like serine/threonine-protein kinase